MCSESSLAIKQPEFSDYENFLSAIDFDGNEDELIEPKEINENNIITIDPLTHQLNNLALDNEFESRNWEIFRTQKNGYKLFSLGYTYTIDKPKLSEVEGAAKIYWKCSSFECKARAISKGLEPPLTITKSHNHQMNPAKLDYLVSINQIKQQAVESSDNPRSIIRKNQLKLSNETISMLKKDAVRQIIQRTRNKIDLSGFNAKCLSSLVIPDELSHTKIKNFTMQIVVKMIRIA